MLAIASAAFFEIPVHSKPAALVTWFDAHPSNEPPPAAAELFCRFLAGQTPKTTPPMTTLADALLAAKDVATPDTMYWTTNAMFQFGGSHWTAWSERGMTALLQTQVRDGEHKGTWAPPVGTSRLATTALHALSLQAHYRYTRVYR